MQHSHWNRRAAGACSCALASAAALLSGCAQILGIDDVSRGRDAAPPSDTRPSTPDARIAPIDAGIDTTCSEGTATDGAGATTIDTDTTGNEFSATCGGESSPDQMLVWTAPVTDYYSFDTFGSGFDTVLALFQECGGPELACSNNVGDVSQSELVYKLDQGQQVMVLVDGAAGDSGQGALNVQRVACPDADLEGQTFPLELSTLGFGNDQQNQCGGADQEDRAYHWVAPAEGMYYFRATSETFTPVVSLIDGPRCSDRQLGCNTATNREYGAEVVRFLRTGQAVSVVVDGTDGAGLFTLDIGLKTAQVCPEGGLDPDGVPRADDFDTPTLSASCWPTHAFGSFGDPYEVPDKVYNIEVFGLPGASCRGNCEITVTSPQAFVLYALEGGDCGGAEISCQLADVVMGTATATIRLEAGDEAAFYTIVVTDRYANDPDVGFDIEASCSAVC